MSKPFGKVFPGSVQGCIGPGFALRHHQSRSICGLTSGGSIVFAIVVAQTPEALLQAPPTPLLTLHVPTMSASEIGLPEAPIAGVTTAEVYVTVTRMRLMEARRVPELSLSTLSRTPKFDALIWAGVHVVPHRALVEPS